MTTAPPRHVLQAFGLRGVPEALTGGQGTSWRVEDVVLKPAGFTVEELEWQADILGRFPSSCPCVAPPVRTQSGELLVDGWSAWTYRSGWHERGRWLDILEVGERFHAHLADVPQPAFLQERTDPWAVADRVAWGDVPIEAYLWVPHVHRLTAHVRPITAPSQVIHGDLTGNVLLSAPAGPAVIDLSPYWRPVGFASAIVVADALVWEGADPRLLEAVADRPDLA